MSVALSGGPYLPIPRQPFSRIDQPTDTFYHQRRLDRRGEWGIFTFFNQSYGINALGGNPILQGTYYLLSMPCAFFLLYFLGNFSFVLTDRSPDSIVRKVYLAFSGTVCALFLFPLLFYRDVATILVALKWIDGHLVTSITDIMIMVFAAHSFRSLRKKGERVYSTLAAAVLALNACLSIPLLLSLTVGPPPSIPAEDAYLVITDWYFLGWNLLFSVALIKRLPAILPHPHPGDAAAPRKETARKATIADERDWKKIAALLIGEGLFREPGLDLPELSTASGLSRNRISQVIGAVTGGKFKDYLNALRFAEFKRIVAYDGYSGGILDAAFEAGFNSKTAFYAWVKKQTNASPGEYLRSLRAEAAASGNCGCL